MSDSSVEELQNNSGQHIDELTDLYKEVTQISTTLAKLEAHAEQTSSRLDEVEKDLQKNQKKTQRNTYAVAVGTGLATALFTWFLDNMVLTF
jgi:chromosome segregation ATPase